MLRKTLCPLALALALLLSFGSGDARAEVSLLSTYNTLFNTSYKSLNAIAADGLRVDPGDSWTLATMNSLQILSMDTSSKADIYLKVNGTSTRTLLYDTPNWNSAEGTRGYELTDLLDLTEYGTYKIGDKDTFSLYVGCTKIDSENARLFLSPNPGDGFLIGFNDNNGGWDAPGSDMNEPLIYGKASTPIPGAVWLLGTGLLGLVGLRRRNS